MASIKPKGNQFTKLELDAIKPEQKGIILRDGRSLSGKVQVVDAGGKQTVKIRWAYYFKFKGKKYEYYCGTYPNETIASIRAKRDSASNLASNGVDPRLEKKIEAIKDAQDKREKLELEEQRKADELRRKVEALTVAELFNDWVTRWKLGKQGVRRKDDNKSIIAMFTNHLVPHIGKVEVKTLNADHLISAYKKLINKGKYKTTKELHKDVGQMIKWALIQPETRALFPNGNPALSVSIKDLLPKTYDNKRERVLSEAEITKLYEAFKTNPVKQSIQLAVWLCLSCTCRIGELAMAEWKHVDFEAKTWFIPAENTKGREEKKTNHTVYLSDFALDTFSQLKELAGDSRWVFPATYKNGYVSKCSISKSIGDRQIKFMSRTRKLQNRVENNSLVIGDEVWTVHDLRRTSSTMIQALIPSVDGKLMADLCLHHSVISGSGGHYLFHRYENEMREAWRLLGERLALLTTKKTGNIVTLKQA